MLTVHTDKLPAGEAASVRVSWSGATDTRLSLRLRWYTTGKAREQGEVAVTRSVQVDGASGETEVPVELPQTPWSYRGGLFSIVWVAEAELAGAGKIEHTVTVGPAGEEALPATPLGR